MSDFSERVDRFAATVAEGAITDEDFEKALESVSGLGRCPPLLTNPFRPAGLTLVEYYCPNIIHMGSLTRWWCTETKAPIECCESYVPLPSGYRIHVPLGDF